MRIANEQQEECLLRQEATVHTIGKHASLMTWYRTSFCCVSCQLLDCSRVNCAGVHIDAAFLWGPAEPCFEGADQTIISKHA